MEYSESRPDAELASVVRCIWRMRGDSASAALQRIAPDGCPEIVINRADPFLRVEDDVARLQSPALAVGQLTRAIHLLPRGEVDLVGIRFHPWGLASLLDSSVADLTDTDVELRSVLPHLRDRLLAASEESDPVAASGAALKRTVVPDRIAPSTPFAARLLGAGHGPEESAARLAMSRRTLERTFRRDVGIGPGRFLRIRRLQRAIETAQSHRPPGGWAAIAAGCGYYDQAHLIREFRLLTGTTPQSYVDEETAMADFFFSN